MLKNIIDFNNNPVNGLPSSEVIKRALKVFEALPGFLDASFYYLDQGDFEFIYQFSTSLSEEDINLIFNELTRSESISQILSTNEITKLKLADQNGSETNNIIIPLVTSSGIFGLVMLLLKKPLDDVYLLNLCKVHSNYIAVYVENSDLILESQNLKEVTEQKIALKTKDIARSTRELKIILDSVQTGIIITDKSNGLVVDLNVAACRLIGTAKEKIIGTPRKNHFFFTKQNNPANYSYLNQEGLLKTYEGALIPIIRTIQDIDQDNMKYTVESFMDISDRKQMEDALHEAHFELEQRVEERTQELLQANDKLKREINDRKKAEEQLLKLYWAVEQSPIAIIITDINGTIEYVNSHFSKISGYKFKDVMGNSIRNLNYSTNADKLQKEIWGNLKKGIEWQGEFLNRKKDGDAFWVSASISPIRNTEGDITHYLSVQEDITERKRVENELVSAKEKAEQSDKLKTNMLANMSHEFRTPLIGILGFSQILIDLIEDPEQHEMISEIQLSGKRLLNTLNGVLNISELETTVSSENLKKTDIVPLIKTGIDEFIKSAKAKNLKFSSEILNNKLLVSLDPQLFRQALNNIVENAFKYTDKGTVSIETYEKEKDGRNWVLIKIKDTGIGISDNHKEIIFEAFRQVSEGYTRNFEGCGLGLTISNKIIVEFGGYITLESKPSSGSVFTIWLPAYQEESISSPDKAKSITSKNKYDEKEIEVNQKS